MGRPLKGSIRENSVGTWTVSVPREFGSRQRRQVTFEDERMARDWLNAALGAVRERRELPDPHRFSQLHGAPSFVQELSGRFADVAWRCWREEYEENPARPAGASRKVEAILRLWLVPYFEAAVTDVSEIRRETVKEFIKVASGRADFISTAPVNVKEAPPYRRAQSLSIAQVVAFTGQSKSSILRHFHDGTFPHATRQNVEYNQPRISIPFGDVLDSGIAIRDGASNRTGRIGRGIGSGGASRAYQREMLSALGVIVTWAIDHQLMRNDPTQLVIPLEPRAETTITKRSDKEPTVFTISQCANIATHLHVHHQIVMWIQRILGLRVAEVFGLRLSDFYDLGELGILEINRQGGRSFWERDKDDRPVRVTHKEKLKTAGSKRTLVVPRQLADALRTYIHAFHADPVTGALDPSRRLVVGLRKPDESGLSSYSQALKKAFVSAGLGPLDVDFSVGTHHLRKSLSTDIRYQTKVGEHIRSELLGHRLSAQGGGATVTMTTYTLKMPVLEPLEHAAREIEGIIRSSKCRLLVPSDKKPSYGAHHYLRNSAWKQQVDAVLADVHAAAMLEDSLSPQDAASLLNVSVNTARQWIREGKLAASRAPQAEAGQPTYLIAPEAVEKLRDTIDARLSVAEASHELGVPVMNLYRAVRNGLIKVEREGASIYLRKSELEQARTTLKGPEGLSERAMTLVEASAVLDVEYRVASLLRRKLILVPDPESPRYPLYVTRESVERECARRTRKTTSRPSRATKEDGSGVVDLEEAIRLTGLSRSGVLQLTSAGVIIRRSQYKFLVDRASLGEWIQRRSRGSSGVES